VQSSLASSANKTVQQLEVDLRSAGEPAAWGSRELLPALMRDIDGAGRMVERRILSASHESLDWLSNELRDNLGIHPLVLRSNAVQIDQLRTPSSGERALRHVSTLQHAPGAIAGSLFAARIAIVGALASVLPSVAIAGATYVATRAFSRASIGRAIDEATREIPPLVEEAFGELESVSMTELDRVYAELAADLDRLVADWPATAAPSDELEQDQSVRLQEVADAASDLEAQIREFLASHEEKASP